MLGEKLDKVYSTEQMQRGIFKNKFNHYYHCQYGSSYGYKKLGSAFFIFI